MPFKINIGDKGKTWKLEVEQEGLVGKSLGDIIHGKDVSPDLEGYELEITGGSDFAGFPLAKNVEGIGLKKVLLTKGWGMHDSRKGIRLRKSVRGKTISEKTAQINMIVKKAGSKKLEEIFPDQNKSPEPEKPVEEAKAAPAEGKREEAAEKIAEEISETIEEEIKEEVPKAPETKTEEKKEEAAEKIAEEIKEESKEVAEKIAKEEK